MNDQLMLTKLDKLILQRQRKRIDGMYNRACNLRDAAPYGLLGADQYEFIDTLYGKQYRRAWRIGNVLDFKKNTREFRKYFRRRAKP